MSYSQKTFSQLKERFKGNTIYLSISKQAETFQVFKVKAILEQLEVKVLVWDGNYPVSPLDFVFFVFPFDMKDELLQYEKRNSDVPDRSINEYPPIHLNGSIGKGQLSEIDHYKGLHEKNRLKAIYVDNFVHIGDVKGKKDHPSQKVTYQDAATAYVAFYRHSAYLLPSDTTLPLENPHRNLLEYPHPKEIVNRPTDYIPTSTPKDIPTEKDYINRMLLLCLDL